MIGKLVVQARHLEHARASLEQVWSGMVVGLAPGRLLVSWPWGCSPLWHAPEELYLTPRAHPDQLRYASARGYAWEALRTARQEAMDSGAWIGPVATPEGFFSVSALYAIRAVTTEIGAP